MSYFHPETGDFAERKFAGMLDMIALTGNISVNGNGEVFIHSHGVFMYESSARTPLIAAGHLKEGRIGYTGEIVLTTSEKAIGRKKDPDMGIEVWDLKLK